MSELRKKDFARFFRDVHGANPFPWQQRLLDEIVERGRWPESLDIPTGCGKTAVLDVALFHLALEAASDRRVAPVRIALVVDRRTVVDQASARGAVIRRALENRPDGVVAAVRERLALLSGDPSRPVHVALLRGGIARDDSWARSPSVPTLIASTVDQIGSRLFFRGYGVSDSMRPVHAGLLGNDALLLLDEVHLSQPFAETLGALASTYRSWAEQPLPDRWQVVEMSATSRTSRHGAFRLDDDDRAHPVLAQRLAAAKPFRLVAVKTPAGEGPAQRALVAACQTEVADLAGPGRAIGVIVNRVAAAREAFEALRATLGARADVRLLTGRMRPLDRGDLDVELLPRIRAGRDRDAAAPCTVVVATQTIEAGADFDFDFLVTECASLDALRQRFGRLNRLGQQPECAGVVLGRADCIKDGDRIYGKAYGATWAYLEDLKSKDLGVAAFKLPPKADLPGMLSPEAHAPVLLPAHLDLWAQTTPVPQPDPDIALWLHGPNRGEPEVQVVWRADLGPGPLSPDDEATLKDRLEACPPTSPEALSLPLGAARRWLRAEPESPDAGDIEGEPNDDPEEGRTRPTASSTPRLAFAWRGEGSCVVDPAAIRPGDTLVVPASYGGVADGNWAPGSHLPVSDLGDRAFRTARGRGSLRTHQALLTAIWPSASPPPVPASSDDEGRLASEDRDALIDWLQAQPLDGVPTWLGEVVRRLLAERRRIVVVPLPGRGDAGHYALQTRSRLASEGEVTSEDDSASFTGVEVPLDAHLQGVAEYAERFARGAGLPPQVVRDLRLAGAWHDAGKADPRFQVMLHGGSRFRAEVAGALLAKSALPTGDRERREEARRRAGYPRGARHELLSTRLLENATSARAEAVDWDLVLHLVASHHGWCRPAAPFVRDDEDLAVVWRKNGAEVTARSRTGLESLDAGVVDRFWRLVRRYGWHGLAWMESVLRLADHRRSEDEQREAR